MEKKELMDIRQVKRSVSYHGVELLRRLGEEQQQGAPTAAVFGLVSRTEAPTPEIKSEEFRKQLCCFIAKKSDLLFKTRGEDEKEKKTKENNIDDSYAIMPPFETFMVLPVQVRREHFYKSLQELDCVTGVVSQILEKGLLIRLLCVDIGQPRDMEDLDIMAYCPQKELPKLYAKESALDAFQEKDIVRGIVHSIDASTERIIMSMLPTALPNPDTYPRIGLITDAEFPVHYRRTSQIDDMSYEEMLHSVLGFNNAGNVQALVTELGIKESGSFLRCNARLNIPEKEYAEGLKKWQSQKLAHQSVAQGVEFFKQGKELEAMQHFSRALQIDPNNVEALVARGALYANKESFQKAIQDFEDALKANPKHNNARNYLLETLLTFGKSCEDKRELEEACAHYTYALTVDADHTEAKDLLAGCQRLMAFQVQQEESKDKSLKPSLITKTAEKLKQLIQEDRQKKGPGSSKKKSWSVSSSSSESDVDNDRIESRKKSRRRSSSSSASSVDRHAKRKHSTDMDRSRKRKRKKEKKRSKKERRKSSNSKEGKDKAGHSKVRKDSKGEKSPEIEFPIKIKNLSSSFLPLSSKDYFSKTTTIPGFGSPEHPPVPEAGSPKRSPAKGTERPKTQEGRKGLKLKSRSPSPKRLQSGSFKRNRSRTRSKSRSRSLRRFRSVSSSRSRSRSKSKRRRSSSGSSSRSKSKRIRSTSRSRSRSKRRSFETNRERRSRSKSLRAKTGVSELDMYLGNIYKAKSPSPGILDEWDLFMRQKQNSAKQSRLSRRSVSRSRSPDHPRQRMRSRSPSFERAPRGRGFLQSSPPSGQKQRPSHRDGLSHRAGKLHDRRGKFEPSDVGRPPSLERSRSREGSTYNKEDKDLEVLRKMLPMQYKQTNKADIERLNAKPAAEDDEMLRKWRKSEPMWMANSRSRSDRTSVEKDRERLNLQEKTLIDNLKDKMMSNPMLIKKDERDKEISLMKQQDTSPPTSRRIMKLEKVPSNLRDIGSSGDLLSSDVKKNFSIVTEGTEGRRVSMNRQDLLKPYSSDQVERYSDDKIGHKNVKTVRKPAMDNPDLNQRLLSSNELAHMERKTREGKERDRPNEEGNKSDDGQNSAKKGKDKKDKKKNKKDKKDKKKKKRSSSGAEGTLNDDNKKAETKWQSEADLEKEIERRVRERLVAEEEKIRKALSLGSSTTSDQKAAEKFKNVEDVGEINKSLPRNRRDSSRISENEGREEDRRKRFDKIEDRDGRTKIHDNGNNSEKSSDNRDEKQADQNTGAEDDSNYDANPKYVETESGWVKDDENNLYYAVKGDVLKPGKNVDKHGNNYVVRAMSKAEFTEATVKLRYDNAEKTRSRSRSRSRERRRYDDEDDRHRSRHYTDRPGRDRWHSGSDWRDNRGGYRGRFVNNRGSRPYVRGRGWNNRGFYGGEERGGFGRGRWGHGSWRSNRYQSRSRSRSRHRSSSSEERSSRRRSRRYSGSRSPQSRSPRSRSPRSRSSRSHSPEEKRSGQIKFEEKSTKPLKTATAVFPVKEVETKKLEVSQKKSGEEGASGTGGHSTGSVQNSRWDTKDSQPIVVTDSSAENLVGVGGGASRWDDGDEEVGKEGDRKGDNSLTDLEKFLKNLKQTKKKQWIAEGKVKE